MGQIAPHDPMRANGRLPLALGIGADPQALAAQVRGNIRARPRRADQQNRARAVPADMAKDRGREVNGFAAPSHQLARVH